MTLTTEQLHQVAEFSKLCVLSLSDLKMSTENPKIKLKGTVSDLGFPHGFTFPDYVLVAGKDPSPLVFVKEKVVYCDDENTIIGVVRYSSPSELFELSLINE